MKEKGFVLFSVIAGLAFSLLAGTILLLTYLAIPAEQSFPRYGYRDYIDRTEGMKFTLGGGAQLYEAEGALLADGAKVGVNALASGGCIVEGFRKGASLEFEIEFDAPCTIAVRLCMAYEGKSGKATSVGNLFSLYIDDVESDTRRLTVQNTGSWFTCRENDMEVVQFGAGKHSFGILSAVDDNSFNIDYLLLIPQEKRTSDEACIGIGSFLYDFRARDGAQRFEAERGEGSDLVYYYDKQSSRGFYAQFVPLSQTTVYVDCDEDTETQLSVVLSDTAGARPLSDVLEVSVNGQPVSLGGTCASSAERTDFTAYPLGTVALTKGVNRILLTGKAEEIFVDYILLNDGVGYYTGKTNIRLEAEEAELEGGCKVETNMEGTSAGGNVGYCYAGSSVGFRFCSRVSEEAGLALCLSYFSDKQKLDEVLYVIVNGVSKNISDVGIGSTGGWNSYKEIYIGKIQISEGENTIVIRSKTGGYNLDYITLVRTQVAAGGGKFEAERFALAGGCQTERTEGVSGNENVGFNYVGSGMYFSFLADGDMTLRLTLRISCNATEPIDLNNCLMIVLNGEYLNLYNVILEEPNGWTAYMDKTVGTLSLHSGLNTLSFVSKSEIYNIDYIELTP